MAIDTIRTTRSNVELVRLIAFDEDTYRLYLIETTFGLPDGAHTYAVQLSSRSQKAAVQRADLIAGW